MTTNDQPSPTPPTPEPSSEPEYSTGPEQLEWKEHRINHWQAHTETGCYYDVCIVEHFADKSMPILESSYLDAHHGMAETVLYRGDDETKARQAAQNHHHATLRRQAWERYMLDNDPPLIYRTWLSGDEPAGYTRLP